MDSQGLGGEELVRGDLAAMDAGGEVLGHVAGLDRLDDRSLHVLMSKHESVAVAGWFSRLPKDGSSRLPSTCLMS